MEEVLYESYVERLQLHTSEQNVCRFCVLKKTNMSIISDSQAGLNKLFHRVTQLELETSADYPNLICQECETALKETASTISAFIEVEIFWRTYLAKFEFENDSNAMENCSNGGSNFEDPPPDNESVQIVDDGYYVSTRESGAVKIELVKSEVLHDGKSRISHLLLVT